MSRSEPRIPGTTSAVLLLIATGLVLTAGLVTALAGLEILASWALNRV